MPSTFGHLVVRLQIVARCSDPLAVKARFLKVERGLEHRRVTFARRHDNCRESWTFSSATASLSARDLFPGSLALTLAADRDMDEFFDRPADGRELDIANVLRNCGIEPHARLSVRRLSGGFQNWNFLVSASADGEFVLRVAKTRESLDKEVAVLSKLGELGTVPIPTIIWRLGPIETAEVSAAAMAYMPGEMLWAALSKLDEAERGAISRQLGEILAKIHMTQFSSFGFLGADLQVIEPVASYEDWTVGFIERCLEDARLKQRLPRSLRDRLRACLDERRDLQDAASLPCLCHGDFNEKNILLELGGVNGPVISAVLDWEFALAGAPQLDIGNLFRFQPISPWIDALRFEEGYCGAGGMLDSNWLPRAHFADLVSLCNFLVSPEERPRTFKTATLLIDKSLDDLSISRA